jgi:hypothetical protein
VKEALMEKSRRKFNGRAFTSLMVALCGLGLPVTGIFNHVHGFDPLTVGRHAWMSAHNALGVLFVVFSVWHVVLNRRPLWNHLRSTAARLPALSREALVAGAVVATAVAAVVAHALHAGGRG